MSRNIKSVNYSCLLNVFCLLLLLLIYGDLRITDLFVRRSSLVRRINYYFERYFTSNTRFRGRKPRDSRETTET